MRYDIRTLLIVLAVLLTANVLLDLGLVWYVGKNLPGSNLLVRATTAVLFSQVILLGFWLALGDAKWHWRFLITVSATTLVAQSVVWGSTDMLQKNAFDRAAYFGFMVLMFLTLLVAVFVFVIPLRRLRQWRLTWQRNTDASGMQQFRIGDLMLWMIPIGVLLAALRIMATLDQTRGQGLIDLAFNLAGLAAIEWGAMLTAFATRRRRIAFIGLIVFTILLGSAFAAVIGYQSIRSMKAVAVVPMPWQYYFQQVSWRSLAVLLSFVAAALIGLLNCLILRLLGCRLVSGRGDRPAPGGETYGQSHGVARRP